MIETVVRIYDISGPNPRSTYSLKSLENGSYFLWDDGLSVYRKLKGECGLLKNRVLVMDVRSGVTTYLYDCHQVEFIEGVQVMLANAPKRFG